MMIDGMNQFPDQTYFYQTDIIGGQKISADRRSGVYIGGLQQHVAQSGGGHGKIPWENSKKQGPKKKGHLLGGLEHFLFSPIVGMMIQSD
jgi:hypothetical protein